MNGVVDIGSSLGIKGGTEYDGDSPVVTVGRKEEDVIIVLPDTASVEINDIVLPVVTV